MPTLLEALGNVADVPGGMIRNTISGHNPLSPLMSPFSQDGRASGSEVLQSWGANPGHDALGFLLELATDPASWVGAGLAAKGLKGAGMIGKGSKLSKLGGLGKAVFKSPDAAKAAWGELTDVAGRAAAKKKVLGMAANQAFGPDMPGFGSRMMNKTLNTLSNPNYKNIANGGGLLQLLTMGRDSGDFEQDVPQYMGQYH